MYYFSIVSCIEFMVEQLHYCCKKLSLMNLRNTLILSFCLFFQIVAMDQPESLSNQVVNFKKDYFKIAFNMLDATELESGSVKKLQNMMVKLLFLARRQGDAQEEATDLWFSGDIPLFLGVKRRHGMTTLQLDSLITFFLDPEKCSIKKLSRIDDMVIDFNDKEFEFVRRFCAMRVMSAPKRMYDFSIDDDVSLGNLLNVTLHHGKNLFVLSLVQNCVSDCRTVKDSRFAMTPKKVEGDQKMLQYLLNHDNPNLFSKDEKSFIKNGIIHCFHFCEDKSNRNLFDQERLQELKQMLGETKLNPFLGQKTGEKLVKLLLAGLGLGAFSVVTYFMAKRSGWLKR